MDTMLQRHCARHIYIVPNGLRELMSDISREVLRSQPDDMCTFIADYLDALLITRENARVAAKFVQTLTESCETIVELLNTSGMSLEEANHAAEVIQEAFKCWSTKKGILKEDEDNVIAKIMADAGLTDLTTYQHAANCIQHAFRAFKNRQEREKQLLGDVIDWRVAARSALQLYRKTGVSLEEAKRAATLIKAAYKGYYTRRTMKRLNEANQALPEEEAEEESGSEDEFTDKKKAVRIDYQSVVPRVDFTDTETIVKGEEFESDIEMDRTEPKTTDESETYKTSSEEYIRGLLEKYVVHPIGEQEPISQDQEIKRYLEEPDYQEPEEVSLPIRDETEPGYTTADETEFTAEATTGAIAEGLDEAELTDAPTETSEPQTEREGTTEEVTELPTTDEE